MRISDWSSDVCSSDLRHRRIPGVSVDAVADVVDAQPRTETRQHQAHRARCELPRTDPHLQLVRDDASHPFNLLPIAAFFGPLLLKQEAIGDALIDRFGSSALESRRIELEGARHRSEEHTSELQSLIRNSYAVFCLK